MWWLDLCTYTIKHCYTVLFQTMNRCLPIISYMVTLMHFCLYTHDYVFKSESVGSFYLYFFVLQTHCSLSCNQMEMNLIERNGWLPFQKCGRRRRNAISQMKPRLTTEPSLNIDWHYVACFPMHAYIKFIHVIVNCIYWHRAIFRAIHCSRLFFCEFSHVQSSQNDLILYVTHCANGTNVICARPNALPSEHFVLLKCIQMVMMSTLAWFSYFVFEEQNELIILHALPLFTIQREIHWTR